MSRINNWYEKDGNTYRYDEYGQFLKDGLYEIDSKLYLFSHDGSMHRGFHEFAGKLYYFTQNGYAQEQAGVVEIEGNRYFFKKDHSISREAKEELWGFIYYIDPITGKILFDSFSHQYGSWKTIQEATCVREGVQEAACQKCGHTEIKPLLFSDHHYGSWSVVLEAACTGTGLQIQKCADCEQTNTELIPVTGHRFESWTTVKSPGCDAEGQQRRSCGVCRKMEIKSIPKLAKIGIKDAKISSAGKREYTGKVQEPEITVIVNGTILKKDMDYTAAYRNNRLPGKAVITIRGTGAYSGEVKTGFEIVPKAPAKVKAKAAGGKTTVTWKKPAKASGCQISYFTSSKFAVQSTKNIRTSDTKAVLRRLKAKKTYYIRVRAYKTSGGKKLFGSYCKSIPIRASRIKQR